MFFRWKSFFILFSGQALRFYFYIVHAWLFFYSLLLYYVSPLSFTCNLRILLRCFLVSSFSILCFSVWLILSSFLFSRSFRLLSLVCVPKYIYRLPNFFDSPNPSFSRYFLVYSALFRTRKKESLLHNNRGSESKTVVLEFKWDE